MCTNKILVQTEYGYVSKCDSCENIQVGYGTTIMSFTQDQFYEFAKTVVVNFKIYHTNYMEYQKKICIATITRLIQLIYSICELKMLSEILEEACMVLGLENLLSGIEE